MSTERIIAAFHERAAEFARRYEALDPTQVHGGFVELIAEGSGVALDVGAGSGRDAAWLASLGYEVVAVEPAAAFRAEAQKRHPEPNIRWLDDRLPELTAVRRTGLSFDRILRSAVWMHVPPAERPRAFRKLVSPLKSGGLLVMSLRDGPSEPDRLMRPAPLAEVEALARQHGLLVVRVERQPDRLGRPEVTWTSVALRLPDDGTGAFPLLRGIILNDDKSSTYKLGLLRALTRIADATPALAVDLGGTDDEVGVPLGLVAMNWVRGYLPLVSARLPQLPGNAGPDGLGFAKERFRTLEPLGVIPQDLRIGARFSGDRALAIAGAIGEAAATIARLPANYIRYPNTDRRIFVPQRSRMPRLGTTLLIAPEFLWSYGTLSIPGHLSRALQRFGSWIEPVIVAEWGRLSASYDRTGSITANAVEAALTWVDPKRDTNLARNVARQLQQDGGVLRCVWTDSRLHEDLDIDHCLPWSAWPNSDLWNLLPASRRVNQHLKRDRLPSAQALGAAREAVLDWWERAWFATPALRERFG